MIIKALLVSHELIRVAILWHELWHEGLEEASRLYFTDRNPEGMIAFLEPLHDMLEAVSHILYIQLRMVLMSCCHCRVRKLLVKLHSLKSLAETCMKHDKLVTDTANIMSRKTWTEHGRSITG